MRKLYFSVALMAVIAFTMGTEPAHAYLDPGNGSMVLQMLLGGIAGVFILFKYFWSQVYSWVKHTVANVRK